MVTLCPPLGCVSLEHKPYKEQGLSQCQAFGHAWPQGPLTSLGSRDFFQPMLICSKECPDLHLTTERAERSLLSKSARRTWAQQS